MGCAGHPSLIVRFVDHLLDFLEIGAGLDELADPVDLALDDLGLLWIEDPGQKSRSA